jgi:DNA polymerase-3 subunit delta'
MAHKDAGDKDGDRLWPPPRGNPALLGQEAAERQLLASFQSGRLPHAWLISGQAGIGKATLAFRFARFLFARGEPGSDSLAVAPSHPVFHRVASGGHADLLTVERAFDEDRGRFRKEIAVDDIRRIAPFLHLTAAEGGWRIVIVDGAEGMNRAGQNAILKILEEPPKQALLLLLTDRPSALLPTIRSRCRPMAMPPLADEVIGQLIGRYDPDIPIADRPRLADLAGGSIGRALEISRQDGVALLSQFLAIAGADPIDWPAGHAFGDRVAAAAADESYRCFAELLTDWLGRSIREAERWGGSGQAGERSPPNALGQSGRLERALEVWEKVSLLFARSDSANLDRRLAVISALELVGAVLRQAR